MALSAAPARDGVRNGSAHRSRRTHSLPAKGEGSGMNRGRRDSHRPTSRHRRTSARHLGALSAPGGTLSRPSWPGTGLSASTPPPMTSPARLPSRLAHCQFLLPSPPPAAAPRPALSAPSSERPPLPPSAAPTRPASCFRPRPPAPRGSPFRVSRAAQPPVDSRGRSGAAPLSVQCRARREADSAPRWGWAVRDRRARRRMGDRAVARPCRSLRPRLPGHCQIVPRARVGCERSGREGSQAEKSG